MDLRIKQRREDEPERRTDGPVESIDEAVVLAAVDGIGPALEHMVSHGVPHATALRVLSAPAHHRRPSTQAVSNALQLVAAKSAMKK
ncbi:hypothetical protein ACLB1G_06200 [Oxalobacteraceae bacterium A2-2]